MGWPVTINGNTYTEAMFSPYGYVDSFPSILSDLATVAAGIAAAASGIAPTTLAIGSGGSAGSPSVFFSGDTDTGWWHPAADTLAWSTGGTERLRLASALLSVASSVQVAVANSTASTSTTTGALTVGGGLGVAGAGYFGGAVTIKMVSASLVIDATTGNAAISFREATVQKWVQYNDSGDFNKLKIADAAFGAGVSLAQGANAWAALSDITLKNRLSDITGALSMLDGVSAFYYTLKSDKKKILRVGFAAQEWQKFAPEIVDVGADGKLSMRYTETLPYFLAAHQEHVAITRSIDARVGVLEARG